ncbi:MAG TPA: chitobiase/beta-hexosaminidase C-terminal domain-containing protein [Candidatus Paceibacterota bacterium]|nr:chitobiase/beta-hexosaminidase C-terminal domain-containing protein [Verrucomicrobiota bacterium]HRY48095.1 chitobiase/beta-hexosaminidase C-terminal domain-containing protein [Candidatus Paceibacterota bacterium]HSA01273.1 chitobiase/beta-hexosaminidase C-terminal domain-containing protein [Candidatus Paceibacterota bacterium]
MNRLTHFIRSASDGDRAPTVYRGLLIAAILAVLGVSACATRAEGTVTTLGGGPVDGMPAHGYRDGATLQEAQFYSPYGCALDSTQNYLYVADRDNGRIRILDLGADLTQTLMSGLNKPVAVAVDENDNLFVITQGDGRLLRLDPYGNSTLVASNLVNPTAVAIDPSAGLYVTESGPSNSTPPKGAVKQISLPGGVTRIIVDGLDRPAGVAVLDSGLLAVSESGRHIVKFLNPTNGQTVLTVGKPGQPGFRDGPATTALFDQPEKIVKTPAGDLVLADRANHRVRIISPSGIVSTLYGVDPDLWECPYEGWLDGSTRYAEAREPVGLAVANDGTVYATEVYYHIIRKITVAGGTGGDTNAVALAPILVPNTGYFPMGQVIQVINPNANLFFASSVYYTTDGSEPTTNSLRLVFTNQVSSIYWHESLRDLTYLKVKAFLSNGTSATATGIRPTENQIGVHRDVHAGIGAGAIIPVTINLREATTIQSLQFRVEITPKTAETPELVDDFQALNVDTNDFIPLPVSNKDGTTFTAYSYSVGKTKGLAISFIGSFAQYEVDRFAVAAMLTVPIPNTARSGDSYTVRVLEATATSDAAESPVILTVMPPRTIQVDNIPYSVGDIHQGVWYNAGDFGGQSLDNADVNAVFYASVGIRLPYQYTDVFDAMDVFPEDLPPVAGGDGQIRFLDWQTVLLRSLRIPGFTRNYQRSWSEGGHRISFDADFHTGGGASLVPAQDQASTAARFWKRSAQLIARPVENAKPGELVRVPVFLQVESGCQISGLQFRAQIRSASGRAVNGTRPDFIPAGKLPQSFRKLSLDSSEIAAAWNIGDIQPALGGSNLVGYLRFTVPIEAQPGDSFDVCFSGADGAPDIKTQYDFETFPASVWVLTPAQTPQNPMSYEWTTHCFGNPANPWAQADADPDFDGLSNLQEYLQGTDPVTLRLQASRADESKPNSWKLRWFAQSGRQYILEATDDLNSGLWSAVASSIEGQGGPMEVQTQSLDAGNRFYRIRLQASGTSPLSQINRLQSSLKSIPQTK